MKLAPPRSDPLEHIELEKMLTCQNGADSMEENGERACFLQTLQSDSIVFHIRVVHFASRVAEVGHTLQREGT